MREEIVVGVVMLAISIIGSIVTRNDRKWSVIFLLLASVAGSLVAGMGIRFREIVEGPFGFLDAVLSVTTATLFVFLLDKAGAYESLFGWISRIRSSFVRGFLTLLFIALPSAFTGFAGASLLTTGRIAGEAFRRSGVKSSKVVEVVAVGSFLGMVMPPNCIPAIIAANGAGSVLPTPYNGFYAPLLAISLPLFVLYGLLNLKALSSVKDGEGKLGLLHCVLVLAAATAFFDGVCGKLGYIGGNTLWFFLSSLLVIILKKGFGGIKECCVAFSDSLMEAVVPAAFTFALGSFIEVSSMTGVRGIFSLWILPYSTTNVMLFLMLIGVVVGVFFSVPVPAFLMTYAVFPIGWLANTVIVTGISMALAIIPLIVLRGSLVERTAKVLGIEDLKKSETLKGTLPVAALMLALGVVFVIFGDGFLSALNF